MKSFNLTVPFSTIAVYSASHTGQVTILPSEGDSILKVFPHSVHFTIIILFTHLQINEKLTFLGRKPSFVGRLVCNSQYC